MNPTKTTNPTKAKTRRKNPTILPVMLASAALFASMAGFLGVQVAQGNDPMLGTKVAAVQPSNGSAATGSSPQSQSSSPQPSPVQTSTSGAASPTASTTSTNSATRASAPGAAQATAGHAD